MLSVKSPDEALKIIKEAFRFSGRTQRVSLDEAPGRVTAEDTVASEFVPDFDRSTVDGYALRAADTFGCSEAIPAFFTLGAEIAMGEGAVSPLAPGETRYVPTGGAVPPNADSVLMMEYAEVYGDGTLGALRTVAPGENLVRRGEELSPGKLLISAGQRLEARHIGALAALGIAKITVAERPRVAVISTGDELVSHESAIKAGQMRDVNGPMLCALIEELGGIARFYGIVPDEKPQLLASAEAALEENDIVLISGGSSVGTKDASEEVISSLGELLFHGLAIKPGKPTILGKAGNKAIFGLPGHPMAAYFVARVYVGALIASLTGRSVMPRTVRAALTEPVSANHGRAQYMAARLFDEGGALLAEPIRGKSGLISALSAGEGFFCIPRDAEGAAAGEEVELTLFDSF